jgi:hypothetical protein
MRMLMIIQIKFRKSLEIVFIINHCTFITVRIKLRFNDLKYYLKQVSV